MSLIFDRRIRPLSFSHILKLWLGILFLAAFFNSSQIMYGADYYVKCDGSSTQTGDGSQSSPWNTLGQLSNITFQGGDHIYFARGTTCSETTIFSPMGSGDSTSGPIVIDAYNPSGSTATILPVISATGSSAPNAVMKLQNQQYWEVNNIELNGGVTYGLYVANTSTTQLQHLHFAGLTARAAQGTMQQRPDSGEIYITSSGVGGTLNDVLVSHVTAGNSHVAEGIYIQAGGVNQSTGQMFGKGVVVEDSLVHDVYGDGILVITATQANIQNNVAYNTGMCTPSSATTCGSSTPSGIWEWYCPGCIVQSNESYANQTYGSGDGGDFDIDASNNNNIVQYNYGHDAGGYCVMLYSSNGRVDTGDIIRYNICSHNEQKAKPYNEGEIYVKSDTNSQISGGQIYNNTIYWSPNSAQASRYAILTIHANYTGTDTIMKNNIIYSDSNPNLIWTTPRTSTAPSFVLDNNIYWVANGATPVWATGEDDTNTNNPVPTNFYHNLNNDSSDPDSFNGNTGQDVHSLYVDPLLNCPTYHGVVTANGSGTVFGGATPENMGPIFTVKPGSPAIGTGAIISNNGGLDFFGHTVSSSAPNIGAYEGSGIINSSTCPM